jgi:hypothetical protein
MSYGHKTLPTLLFYRVYKGHEDRPDQEDKGPSISCNEKILHTFFPLFCLRHLAHFRPPRRPGLEGDGSVVASL